MSSHWSTHQMTEYLVGVSRPRKQGEAMAVALDRAIESLEAEVGALVRDGQAIAAVGFGNRGVPEAFVAGASGDTGSVSLDGIGVVHLVRGELDRLGARSSGGRGRLVVGRLGEGYSAEESQVLQGMALVLGLVLHNLEALQVERSRHRLVETLLAIQRAVSARRPLKEVLDAVTCGASTLLGGCPVALLLADPLAPGALMPASVFEFHELDAAALAAVEQVMAGGVGSSRSAEGDVLVEPVGVDGEIAGCLAARVNREQVPGLDDGELLEAFAQQVSLALTDARTLDAVREAYHDSITGLPTRVLFLERAEQAWHAALGHGHDLTVLFVDLDRFKAVNDTLGHQAGDDLLAQVARRIQACVRPSDVAARLGGDEFAVLLDRADVTVGVGVAERIIGALTQAFTVSGRDVFIGASVGIAGLTLTTTSAGAMLGDADVAMYCAKRSGRGRAVVFEPSMHDDVATRLTMRSELQHAQTSGQLWVAYQPIVRLDTGLVEGVEALMRWTHPERGAIPPSEFIPIAEESQMIVELGTWVLRQALAEVTRWRGARPDLGLSVNVSVRQIADPDLPAIIASALENSGVDASALTLEITESLLMDDPEASHRRLVALKDLGLHLAIDDFGTGYSSLAYVRQFPVDRVKIDRSFVRGLAADSPEDVGVVKSVLSLCQSLHMSTVAEGIERPEQAAILAELGCDLGQGYLFAAPAPAREWGEAAPCSSPF
jgi:diguanylate cyclase (GGDEF)-like protein